MWQIVRIIYDELGNEKGRRYPARCFTYGEAHNLLHEFNRLAMPLGELLKEYVQLNQKLPGYIHPDDINANYIIEEIKDVIEETKDV